MKRGSRRRALAAGVAAVALVLVLSLTVSRFAGPAEAPPPGAIERIVAKNRDAAAVAAAAQRSESAEAAEAADRAIARNEAAVPGGTARARSRDQAAPAAPAAPAALPTD